MIYNRETQQLEKEVEYGAGKLDFLYNTLLGRILLSLVVARPWFSKLRGGYQKSKASKKDIAPFAEKYGIKVDNLNSFGSFNDFFTRKKEIVYRDFNPRELRAVCDGKMRYYTVSDTMQLKIKNSIYDLEDILEDEALADRFKDGTCIVFRLTVDDYHRYHYPDNGRLVSRKRMKGKLHTVRPISEKYKVYSRNTREVSLLETESMGEVLQIEVGALLVGKIVNHNSESFLKMQEKGYFEFGGSTVILLFNKPLVFDDDIVKMNSSGVEIKVRAGERIGIIC